MCIAALACLPSLWKPLTIDDAAYVQYARQILHDPTRPYDFTIHWNDSPQPAGEVLAPALVPYWWALGMRLLGESEFLWHLWFLPFAILAAWAIDRLCVRFEVPRLLALLVFFWSPLFVPQVNFMLDVPSLALGLAGMAVLASDDRGNAGCRHVVAGILLGLALLAKYSALGIFAAVACYGIAHRRRDCLWTLLAAVLLVVTWESWLWLHTGQSHWWSQWTHAAEDRGLVSAKTWRHGWEWVVFMGAALPLLGLLPMFGREHGLAPRNRLALACVVGLTVARVLNPAIALAELAFAAAGCLFIAAAVTSALKRRERPTPDDLFLLGWFAVEALNAVLPVPFMAMRRCLSPAVPAVLLILRGVSLWEFSLRAVARPTVAGLVAAGCLLGFLVGLADCRFAWAQRDAVLQVGRDLADSGDRAWLLGHWGWQHYGEAAGLQPLVPGSSRPRPGDLVVAASNVDSQRLPVELIDSLELVRRYESADPFPLRIQNFQAGVSYHGAPGVPYAISLEPHLRAFVWRIHSPVAASPHRADAPRDPVALRAEGH